MRKNGDPAASTHMRMLPKLSKRASNFDGYKRVAKQASAHIYRWMDWS
jgi:hypothetical protein